MLLRQFHIIEDSEENLEEILPPMWFERRAMCLNNIEKYCQRARSYVQFAPAHYAGQFKQQRKPSSHLKEKDNF